MDTPRTQFDVRYGGKAYTLSIRTADDGYVTGWEYAAAQTAVLPFLTKAYVVGDQLFSDEQRLNQLMVLITEEGAAGGWRRTDGSGVPFTPLPWRSWAEIPLGVLREVVESFFLSFASKTRRLNPSESFIGVPMSRCTQYVCELLTAGSSPSWPAAPASEMPSELRGDTPGSAPSAG